MSTHLFLSPHLDDAVLSCGGVMHQLGQRGEQVIILTAMAGEPTEPLPESPVLGAVKSNWGDTVAPVSARRAEDAQAAHSLGAKVYHLALLECAFRTALCGAGDWIPVYPDHDSPFGEISDADEARLILFETQPPFPDVAAIYAPFCVDDHVDHRLVRDWALILTGSNDAPALVFYEEYPHARNKASLQRAQAYFQRSLPALAMHDELIPLSEDDLDAKLRAMRCYRSHLHILWNDLTEMETLTRDYVSNVGNGMPAERFWRVVR